MEKGKDSLNAYLAGLKNSCSTECLRSLQLRKLTPPTEGPTAHFISKIQQTSSTSKKKTLTKEVILFSIEVTSLCTDTPLPSI